MIKYFIFMMVSYLCPSDTLLEDLRKEKIKKKHTYRCIQEKKAYLKAELLGAGKWERLRILRSVLLQSPITYH